MAYDGSTWDETQPTQSTLANTIDSVTRDVKSGVRARMANEHNWVAAQSSTASGGQHLYISFQQQPSTPVFPLVGTTTQDGILYSSSGVGLCYSTYNTGAFNVVTLVGSGQTINISNGYYSATGTIGDILIGQTGTSHTVKVLPAPILTSGASSYCLISQGTTGDPFWAPPRQFGAWDASKSIGSIYQAPADGFVLAYITMTNSGGGGWSISGFTDSSSNPTTLRVEQNVQAGSQQGTLAITLPVRKGDYWKVTVTAGGGVAAEAIYWLPVGN